MTRHPGSFEIDRHVTLPEPLLLGHDILTVATVETEALATPQVVPADAENPAAKTTSAVATRPKRRSLRRMLLVAASVAALGAGSYYGDAYWTVGRFQVSTDDAYVQADSVTIAPKISGYLGAVLVGDNAVVAAGQVLARIDDRDYRVALEQARADVAAAVATVASRQVALDAQQSIIATARSTITVDEANQTFAEQENRRYADLATSGYGSTQNAQGAASRIAGARASIQRDTAALSTATKQVDLLRAEVAQAAAALSHARAVQDQADLNLGYSAIVAPVAGMVGNRSLRVGQYVQAGTQLMAVVPVDDAYVVANFKETQLTDVRPGQFVDIAVDMFPGRPYHGRVDSLAPASGQTFALLPPDNATGNFTKVVQRIPVRIALDPDGGSGDLRPGMSVTPSIDTKAKPTTIKTARGD